MANAPSRERAAPSGNGRLLERVARYYSGRIAQFGATPKGVDWNGAESQCTRFAQLSRLFEGRHAFSINDLGCGYGALYDYLVELGHQVDYRGYDVSAAMLQAARARQRLDPKARFFRGSVPSGKADFTVASGIFNVKLDARERGWLTYITTTLEAMDRTSRSGFAFNCLTRYSDKHRQRRDLYYADPGRLFDLCMRRFSRNVALLHDYRLFEFTILVRKFQRRPR